MMHRNSLHFQLPEAFAKTLGWIGTVPGGALLDIHKAAPMLVSDFTAKLSRFQLLQSATSSPTPAPPIDIARATLMPAMYAVTMPET
jgi:hypothetical protein